MRVVVGRVGRPHGIRGEVTVEVRTDEPDRRFASDAVLSVEGSARTLTVAATHWHSGRLLVQFVGVDDRNAAEAIRGSILEAERPDDEVPDDPEEFYDAQLVGCSAVVAGEVVGDVADVVHLPAQDLLLVRLAGSEGVPEREVLVPFVQAIVPSVDVVSRRVVIDPPPGLLDAPDDRAAPGQDAPDRP